MGRREGDEIEMRVVTDKIFFLIGKVVGSRFVMKRLFWNYSGNCFFFFSYVNVSLLGIQREEQRQRTDDITFPTYLIYPTENHHK